MQLDIVFILLHAETYMLNGVKNPPKNTTCWCGPGALSIITGWDYETARQSFVRVTGKRSITRVYNHQMLKCLNEAGFRTIKHCPDDNMTLAAWLKARPPEHMDKTFLVQVTGHYIVVRGRKACDNRTKEPVFLTKMHSRRARVQCVWEVYRPGYVSRERFVAIAKQVGVTFAVDSLGRKLTIKAPRGWGGGTWTTKVIDHGNYWEEGHKLLTPIALRIEQARSAG